MDPIKYNDTANYQYICIFGHEGVYTPEDISAETLPQDFRKYSLIAGDQCMFSSLSAATVAQPAGSFITKSQLEMPSDGVRSLSDADWSFPDKDFDFEAYYGTKLSFDLQVEQAEAKRDAKREEKRAKHREKTKVHSEPNKEI